jgi:hypothetical protein
LPDDLANWRVAEIRARQIEDDMRLQLAHGGNYFDPTLDKYKPESSLSLAEPDISPKSVPKLRIFGSDTWLTRVLMLLPRQSMVLTNRS